MIRINSNNESTSSIQSSVIALGNFDGVHLGHRMVVGKAVEIAHTLRVPSIVITFEPHPKSFFLNSKPPFRLTPAEDKALLIERMGIDVLFEQKFDRSFSQKTAEVFVNDYLVDMFHAKHIVIGYDFAFGQGRQGNSKFLEDRAKLEGFTVTRVAEITNHSEGIISSTKIRALLADGECSKANTLLGRYWEVIARVESGDQRGRTLGFPTANLSIGQYMHPRKGVYAVQVGIRKGKKTFWHHGVANFGVRPTFDNSGILLEVHLLAFTGDLYGQTLRVAFIEFIRPETKFDGIKSLKLQLEKDCIKAKNIFNTTTIINNSELNLRTS